MPLMVEDKPMGPTPKSVPELIHRYIWLKEKAILLSSKPPKVVGPHGLLYVGQREMAVVDPEDNFVQVLGTDDATTCHIVILKHTGSNVVGLAHFDGSGVEEAVRSMIDRVSKVTGGRQWGRFELTLVGGFKDVKVSSEDQQQSSEDQTSSSENQKSSSEELSIKVLDAFNKCPEEIHLIGACITDLNTRTERNIPFPIIYGLAVIVKTGEMFPAKFPDKGPDLALRSARHFTGSEEVLNIYDNSRHEMVIGPFEYTTMDEINMLCRVPDPFIRQFLSTSPEQEPPHFEASVRAALVMIRDHPEPMKTIFANGKGHRYVKEPEGKWKPV